MAAAQTADGQRSLAGYQVLVTRPADRADALIAALSAHGASVVAAPLLAIEILPETPALRAVAQDLARFDSVIVTSVYAVRAWLPLLQDFWPQWPHPQNWFAIGEGTAAALAAYGIVARVPGSATSEGLLALPELSDVHNRHMLLVAGEGGRDTLENALRSSGARLVRIATYRRVACDSGRNAIDAFGDSHALAGKRVVLVTSSAALQNLLALAPWLPGSDVTLVVASARTGDEARRAGIGNVVIAAGAGDAQQLAALQGIAGKPDNEAQA